MSRTALARLAGALVLALVVVGPIAMVLVPGQLVVPGDPAATRAALLDAPGLQGLGLAAEAAVVAIEIALTAILYVLFRPTGPALSATAALARTTMLVLQGVGLLLGVGLFLGAAGATPEQVGLLVDLRHATILTWQVPFGLHLLLLAVLVWRDRGLPRLLAPGLALAGLGYLQHTVLMLAFPDAAPVAEGLVAGAALLGELPLFVWMLVRGVRADGPPVVDGLLAAPNEAARAPLSQGS